jgi:hypothetical protein
MSIKITSAITRPALANRLHRQGRRPVERAKRGGLLDLHDNLTGLFLDPCGFVLLLKLFLHILGSLLEFL